MNTLGLKIIKWLFKQVVQIVTVLFYSNRLKIKLEKYLYLGFLSTEEGRRLMLLGLLWGEGEGVKNLCSRVFTESWGEESYERQFFLSL